MPVKLDRCFIKMMVISNYRMENYNGAQKIYWKDEMKD